MRTPQNISPVFLIMPLVLSISAFLHGPIGGLSNVSIYTFCGIYSLCWIFFRVKRTRELGIIEQLRANKDYTTATITQRQSKTYGGTDSDLYIEYRYICEATFFKQIWKSEYIHEKYPVGARVNVYYNSLIHKKIYWVDMDSLQMDDQMRLAYEASNEDSKKRANIIIEKIRRVFSS